MKQKDYVNLSQKKLPRMSETPFSEPRRQEVLGVILLFGQNLRRFVNIVLAFVVGSSYSKQIPISINTAIIIAGILMAVFTIFQYLRFYFHIEAEEFVLKRGVFKKEQLRIPFDRIQTVHVSQNVIQQIFGLSGLKIDTAGSGKEELKIIALTNRDAQLLKTTLQKGAKSVSNDNAKVDCQEGGALEDKRTLVTLSLKQLIVVGLTQNHIRSGFVALGVLWAWWWQLKEWIGEDSFIEIEEGAERLNIEYGDIMSSLLYLIALALAVFIVASVIVSIIRTVLRHFGLRAKLDKERILVESGLLKRNEYTVPLSKIQMLIWEGNVLRRIPGFESMLIKQSKSDDTSRKLNIEIPALYPKHTEGIVETVFGQDADREMIVLKPHKFFRFYKGVWYALGGIGLALVGYLNLQSLLVFVALAVYLLLVIMYSKKYFEKVELRTNGELVEYRIGWLVNRRIMLQSFKLQSVRFSQSIFQRRRGTAHLRLYTAGGALSLRFLDVKEATEMYNYLLYKIETTDKKWM